MASKNLNIRINLTDLASGKLTGLDMKLKNVGVAGSAAGAGLASMLGPLTVAIASFTTLQKALSGIGSAINLFAKFDDTMRKVGAVTKANDAELKAMTETAKTLGATTRYTATEAAEALSFLGMAGFQASEAIEALPNVLNLAAAGGLDLGQAADIATNILSGFGLEVDQLARVNDVLAETFTSSNTSLTELGEGFKYVGPIAKGVGADFEDLLAAMGKLGDAGIKASMSGTTLRGIIEALFNPTREEQALMGELAERIGGTGLEIRNTKGDFVGFRRIVEQLEKAGLKGEEALKLFGARAGPGMAALVEVGSEALGELTDQLDTVDKTTSKITSRMEGGIGGALRGLASAAEGAGLALGEAFGEGLIESVQSLTTSFQNLKRGIEDLHNNGVIGLLTASVNGLAKAFSFALDFGIAYIKEFSNGLGILYNAVTFNFDGIKQRFDKVGSSFREMLQDRELLSSDSEIQLAFINKQTEAVEKQIKVVKEKIEQDREDVYGWRAKTFGAEVYIEQLGVHQKQLQDLYKESVKLKNQKIQIQTQIKLEGLAKSIVSEVTKAEKETEKIGTGKEGGESVADKLTREYAQLKAQREVAMRALKNETAQFLSDLDVQAADLESRYSLNFITMQQYYEGRRRIIEEFADKEIAVLEEKAKIETDATKLAELDTKIYQKKQKLVIDLTKLETEHYKEVQKKEDELIKIQAENIQKRLDADRTFKDLQDRIEAGGMGIQEATFMKELADLQARQKAELAIVEDGIADEIRLQEFKNNQKMEKDQLEFDHWKQLMQARLTLARETFGGTASAFEDLYELTGKKQKEWFYLAKAASIAEATISTASGIMKAYEQMGAYGSVGAALVAVQGAIQIAKISSTGLAEGGIVPGHSPNNKADNIPARLTAGEYVQPVDTVKHYGIGVMEALRKRVIPREALFNAGIKASNIAKFRYAEGGGVPNINNPIAESPQKKEEITIVNYTDRQELLSALSTSDGINAIVNVISANRERITRVLR